MRLSSLKSQATLRLGWKKALLIKKACNPCSFQNYCVIETGLLDFHRMVVTVLKTSFERLKPTVINYIDYNRKQIISRRIIVWIIKCSFRWKSSWCWRVCWNMSKNSKSSCHNQTKVCMGQTFVIYEQNPFKCNNA